MQKQLPYERVPVASLTLDPRNARKHDKKNLKAIKDSLVKFGQQRTIVVTKDNVVIAGNGTVAAAKELGWETIDITRSQLTGEDAVAYGLVDNRASELAEWDDDNLKGLLSELSESGWDIEGLGWDSEDLKGILPDEKSEGLTDEDAVPEVEQNVFGVKLGDIWQLGSHRLMCGDSTDKATVEKLMNGEKADMVFTDPPFPNNSGILHDMIKNIDLAFESAKTVCFGDQVWFWDNICSPPFGKVTARHVWHKTNGWQAGHWESINVFHADEKRHECKVLSFPNVGQDGEIGTRKAQGYHPTPKPIALIIHLFDELKAGENLLDLFLGSGSTLIACEKTGRKCYGMEIDPHYCSVIIKRWQDFTGKVAVKL